MQADRPDPLFEEALVWLMRFDAEAMTPENRRAFDEWLANPAHAEAYARAQALWQRFEIIQPELDRARRGGKLRRRAVIGGLFALAGGTALYMATRPGFLADHRTGTGERRQIALTDGSLVELGSRSALSVDYAAAARRLVLHEGQAFFTVAPDADRPFTVMAGDGAVTALGTAFDVKLMGGDVVVTVTEHAVSVQRSERQAVVEAGWQVGYSASGLDSPVPADLTAASAWRQDLLIFEDVPLRRVLMELERYRSGPVLLADPALGDLSVTAIINVPEADAALRRIAETLPIGVLDMAGLASVIYAN